jgi:lipopolysaccharide/colanic/teichoic acid biosynthesis glycosyltransferase
MRHYFGKRILDLMAAGTACAAFAPLAAGIALAIWLEDGGSPLFLQTRIGYQRRPFTVFKFRTMRNQQVTRVGRWLRQTGLDELPQFINVCAGQMSVIGPRPLTAQDIQRLGWGHLDHDWRFEARPGITGLSQLLAGRSARYSRRLERLYLRRQSFLLDLQVVGLSFGVCVLGKRVVRRWLRRTPATLAQSAPLPAPRQDAMTSSKVVGASGV